MALSYFAGMRLTTATFDALYAQLPRTFVKGTAQKYNTNTTFQNDNDLVCSLEANSTYEVLLVLSISGTDGDLKVRWSAPSDATGTKLCFGPALSSTDRTDTTMRAASHQLATSSVYGVNSAVSDAAVIEHGIITTVTAGTLTIQHAQQTSTANDSGLSAFSKLTIRKVV